MLITHKNGVLHVNKYQLLSFIELQGHSENVPGVRKTGVIKIEKVVLGRSLILALKRQRKADLHESKTSMIYIRSSRTARIT